MSRLVDAVEPDPGETTDEMELVAPEETAYVPQTTADTPVSSPFSLTSPFPSSPFEFPSDSPSTFTFTASPSFSFGLSGSPPNLKGTTTVANVRPAGWDRFQALCGFIDKSHKCVYVQGHLLYERLGGRGNRMANLAPFTASLNKRHQNQVEKPLWAWLKAAPSGEERTIDYNVVPTYGGGGPPSVMTDAQGYFQRFVDNRNADALKRARQARAAHAADVAAVQGQPRGAAVNLAAPKTAHTTWAALCSAFEQELADYVGAAFPAKIDCYARRYKRTSSTADWDKTVQQHHTLTNHR